MEKFFSFLCSFRRINTFAGYNNNVSYEPPFSGECKMRMLEKFRRTFEIWLLCAMGIITVEEPQKKIEGGSTVPLRITAQSEK